MPAERVATGRSARPKSAAYHRPVTAPEGIPPDPIELLVDLKSFLGEGPVWDIRTGRVAWVDILAGRLHLTARATGPPSPSSCPRRWVASFRARPAAGSPPWPMGSGP